jgi:hypothetical protein
MHIKSVELGRDHGFPWRDLVVHVDRIPDLDNFVFDAFTTDLGITLYIGTFGDLVKFYAHDPNSETGFGGRTFTLRMRDESEVTIKGPWSSRASVINEYFPELRCSEIILTEEGSRSRIAGYCAREALFARLCHDAGGLFIHAGAHRFYATA